MKPARDMSDEELEAEEPRLKAVATRHSPVCVCKDCHRYIEIGTEVYDRQRAIERLDEIRNSYRRL